MNNKMVGTEVNTAVEQLANCPLNASPHIEVAAKRWGLPYDELAAACAQEAQAAAIQGHAQVRQQMAEVVDRYCNNTSLLELAYALECPPCLLARRLLESVPCLGGRQRSTQVLRNPSLLLRQQQASAASGSRGDTQVDVDDALVQRLQRVITEAAELDTLYSPQADIIRHVLGLEYEAILEEKLRNACIPFFSERFLRGQGFFKTPDIKLQVPVLIKGRLVNWIDSKATFGSQRLHMQQREQQYDKYINRFGPGAVIYWFGFVEDLAREEIDLLVLSSFPHDIVQLPRLQVPAQGCSGIR